ncbi:MAG TPA: isoprenyl transferase [Moheibacter sp.]|nr:isoprenyl transferase [Moheibacter sp.]
MNLSNIDTTIKANLPQHVAIIMDGNGRWAKRKGLERTFGHQEGVKSVREAISTCGDLGIPYLTLYAFSTENWKRPRLEVSFLMRLLSKTIQEEINELHEKGIKLSLIGALEDLPKNVRKSLADAVALTQNNQKANLIIALNYGAQAEIVRATKQIAEKVKNQEIALTQIDEKLFEQHLYTQDLPQVDLLIRTSGEQRISNFLLWQIAYSELYFSEVLWPDFRKEHFVEALRTYALRERRYGQTGEQIKTD